MRHRSHWLTCLDNDPSIDALRSDGRLAGTRARIVPL